MNNPFKFWLLAAVIAGLPACEQPDPAQPEASTTDVRYRRAGRIQAADIDEISGLQASRRYPGVLWAHDDGDTPALLALDTGGEELGRVAIAGITNRDWEDITLVPGENGDLLVIADTGDNRLRHPSAWLYFVPEPRPGADGRYGGQAAPLHALELRYPDSPQDIEAVAFDPLDQRILLLGKRTHPPRLYGLDLAPALARAQGQAQYLGTVETFRPPATRDRLIFGDRARWVARPTGMDISPDGARAAVITYRSLYLFELGATRDWAQALRGERLEIVGPDALREEAVTFSADGLDLFVTSEGRHAPIFHYRLPDPVGGPGA